MHRTDEPTLLARHRPAVLARVQTRVAANDQRNARPGIFGKNRRVILAAKKRFERIGVPRIYLKPLPARPQF